MSINVSSTSWPTNQSISRATSGVVWLTGTVKEIGNKPSISINITLLVKCRLEKKNLIRLYVENSLLKSGKD